MFLTGACSRKEIEVSKNQTLDLPPNLLPVVFQHEPALLRHVWSFLYKPSYADVRHTRDAQGRNMIEFFAANADRLRDALDQANADLAVFDETLSFVSEILDACAKKAPEPV